MRFFTNFKPKQGFAAPRTDKHASSAGKLVMACLLLSASAAAAQTYTQLFPPQEFAYGVVMQDGRYVVAKDDTLYGISRRFNLSVTRLDATLGGGELYAGQIISLPFSGNLAPKVQITTPAKQNASDNNAALNLGRAASNASNDYEVRAGDTLWSLSRIYHLPVDQIAAANGLGRDAQLKVGQRLIIPAATGKTGEEVAQPAAEQSSQPQTVNSLVISGSSGQQSLVIQAPVKAQSETAAAPLSAPTPATPAPASTTEPQKATESKTASKAASTVSAAQDKAGRPGMLWPVRGNLLMDFGLKADGITSNGIVIAASEGAPVVAADEGEVMYAGDKIPSYGNMILLRHKDGISTVYGNNQTLLVKAGDKVSRGQKIALAGQTGDAKRAQVTFEVRLKEKPVNPLDHLGK